MAKHNKRDKEKTQTEAIVETANQTVEATGTETSTTNPTQEIGENKKMEQITLKVTRSITSLDTMEDVELVKLVPFENVTDESEALTRLNNDRAKFLEVINEGLQAIARKDAKLDNDGWRTVNDKGELNGPFIGEMADSKKVGSMILTFARLDGYSDTKETAKRKKIKDAARELVKNLIRDNPTMRAKVVYTGDEDDVVKTESGEESENQTA